MAQSFVSLLKQELGDSSLVIKLTKPPSYISCFVPDSEIIILHKVDSKKLVNKSTTDHKEHDISNISDVTGNPLETSLTTGNVTVSMIDPIECPEINEEKNHLPLSLTYGRKCLNICNLKLRPPHPVWTLIDGNDHDRTVLLSTFTSKGWVTRSWAKHKGVISGVPSLENLQGVHAYLTGVKEPLISSQIKSTYVIRNVSNHQSIKEFYSCTMLQAIWEKFTLDPPMDPSTNVKLITKCNIGKGSGGLLFLWRQLQLIHQYVELILDRSRNDCLDKNVDLPSFQLYLEACNKTPGKESPVTRIGKLLNEPTRVRSSAPKKSLNEIIELFASNGRPVMDIIDKLWFLFIECSTYHELCACVKQLFIEIKKVGFTTPYINSNNVSCLANCFHGGANISNPLEYLVEVGFDKLKNDILFIFSNAKIATLSSLNMPKLPKFSEVAASDWMSTVQMWLTWFSQIHCVLELLWNTQEAMFVSDSVFVTLAATALTQFVGDDSKIQNFESLMENPMQEIELNVPILSVERQIQSTVPLHWVLKLNTELEASKIESTFYRGLQSPFAHIRDVHSETIINTTSDEDVCYYWAEHFKISDMIDL